MKGNLTRKTLSEFYADYLLSYEECVKKYGFLVSTAFFVFSDNKNPDDDPVVFPVDGESLKNKEYRYAFMKDIAKTFKEKEFPLELLMYVEGLPKEKVSSGQESFLFGAKALDGSTVHSLFLKEKLKDSQEFKIKKVNIKNKFFDIWVLNKEAKKRKEETLFKDHFFLNELSKEYSIAQSLENLYSNSS